MPWVSRDKWEEPEWTLGWQVADWAERYFRVPGGADYGKPLTLTGWQLRALADWYAVDRSGVWLYRRGQLRLAKGTGKSPFAAVVVLAELCGPSRFDGWDASGDPVGAPVAAPWIQIAAVSEDQTGNTYNALHAMVAESDLIDDAGLDLGVTRMVLKGRPGRVEMVTASAGSREGQPITAAICDETHLWTRSNGGRRLYATIRRNASKMGGRVLATTNAYDPGAESVAEQVEATAGTTPGILIYGPQYEAEVVDLSDREKILKGLERSYRDAPWVDLQRVASDCQDPDMAPEDVIRFHFNLNRAADSVLCESPDVWSGDLEPGAPMAVGFDGSRSWDATALVAVHMVTGAAFLFGYWERPVGHTRQERWEVPRGEVAATLDVLFARCQVVRMKADPSHWQDELAGWQQRWGREVVDRFSVWQTGAVDDAVTATQDALRSGVLSLARTGDPLDGVLRGHVSRCRVVRRMIGSRVLRSLGKPDDGGKIDAAAALVYAQAARLDALSKGWEPSEAAQDPVVVW